MQTLLAATKIQDNSNVQYFWDMMSPLVQFMLLNQSAVLALPYNVTEKVLQNVTNLHWESLPANVKEYLLSHEAAQLLYMQFSKWGWIDSKNMYSMSTLFSLMTRKDQQLAPNIVSIILPIHFNLRIDMNALNNSLNNDVYFSYFGGRFFQKNYLVAKFFDSLFQFFENWFDQALVAPSRRQKQTANSIFSQAVYKSEAFVIRQFILNNKRAV